jgi:signal peptidase II
LPQARPSAQQDASTKATRNRAGRNGAAIVLFAAVVLAGVAADLLSKHFVFKNLLDDPALSEKVRDLQVQYPGIEAGGMLSLAHPQWQVVPGVMRFTLSTNPGVVFSTPLPRGVVIVTTAVAIVLVLIFFATSPARAYWIHTAMALILAGAAGNLYDRLFSEVTLPGMEPIRYQVRDFLDCSQIHYNYIFNVADVFLVAGVAMLLLQGFSDWRKTRAKVPSTTPAA